MRGAVLAGGLVLLALGPRGAMAEELVRAPLPPPRPFDLDLAPKAPPLSIMKPPEKPATTPLAATASVASGDKPAETPLAVEPDEDEGVEWPKLTLGQKAGAEPDYDPNEKPDVPGISTDPGTSIACLPPTLKVTLQKIADRYGAVKVTSTWRPPWRARRASYHKTCQAMDFRVPGVRPRAVLDYARSLPDVGGNKVYWNGIIHVDTGPRRAW